MNRPDGGPNAAYIIIAGRYEIKVLKLDNTSTNVQFRLTCPLLAGMILYSLQSAIISCMMAL